MQCPICYHLKSSVCQTRHNLKKNVTYRRRKCKGAGCGFLFTSVEMIKGSEVEKNDSAFPLQVPNHDTDQWTKSA